MDVTTTKMVVAGPFGSGKTTFVTSASGSGIVSSEYDVTDATVKLKPTTTVALDHGVAELTEGDSTRTVSLFGVPGQDRFSFMWPTLARGMSAYILMVDASRLQSLAQLKKVAGLFGGLAPHAPYVVAANRWDTTAMTARDLAEFVDVPPDRVLDCDPRDSAACHAVLKHLLDRTEGENA